MSEADRIGETLIQSGLAYLGLTGEVKVQIAVTFADGTVAFFVLTGTEQKAKYQQGQSRTAEGQIIPEELGPTTSGQWQAGAGGNLDDLTLHMNNLGAHVSFAGNVGVVITLECTWKVTTQGGFLDCVANTN
ncbi:MAG: hypothetical protein LCH68_16575 [Proteobacteria bacterium]|nr:hypothetical protein [Pseudomonadota bacterium]